jgi:hypothetical protein
VAQRDEQIAHRTIGQQPNQPPEWQPRADREQSEDQSLKGF